MTLNHDNDNYGYAALRNFNARTELNKLINDMGFVDAHRDLHGKKNCSHGFVMVGLNGNA